MGLGAGPGLWGRCGGGQPPCTPQGQWSLQGWGVHRAGDDPPPPEAVEGWHWLQDLRWVWGGGGRRPAMSLKVWNSGPDARGSFWREKVPEDLSSAALEGGCRPVPGWPWTQGRLGEGRPGAMNPDASCSEPGATGAWGASEGKGRRREWWEPPPSRGLRLWEGAGPVLAASSFTSLGLREDLRDWVHFKVSQGAWVWGWCLLQAQARAAGHVGCTLPQGGSPQTWPQPHGLHQPAQAQGPQCPPSPTGRDHGTEL